LARINIISDSNSDENMTESHAHISAHSSCRRGGRSERIQTLSKASTLSTCITISILHIHPSLAVENRLPIDSSVYVARDLPVNLSLMPIPTGSDANVDDAAQICCRRVFSSKIKSTTSSILSTCTSTLALSSPQPGPPSFMSSPESGSNSF
jgi:hypothetical protein